MVSNAGNEIFTEVTLKYFSGVYANFSMLK